MYSPADMWLKFIKIYTHWVEKEIPEVISESIEEIVLQPLGQVKGNKVTVEV